MPIRAIALDIDGVLTDGGVWWGADGQEWKRFSFADIMGLSLARKAYANACRNGKSHGVCLALISGESSPLIDRLARKIDASGVYRDCKDKAWALRSFAEQHHLHLDEICFMGDDVNDVAALKIAGLAAAPANARATVTEQCHFVTNATGGNGAVRELIEYVLSFTRTEALAGSRVR